MLQESQKKTPVKSLMSGADAGDSFQKIRLRILKTALERVR